MLNLTNQTRTMTAQGAKAPFLSHMKLSTPKIFREPIEGGIIIMKITNDSEEEEMSEVYDIVHPETEGSGEVRETYFKENSTSQAV